jgi:predicted TIM-barrel fold metal-dependent hydrolase
MKLRSLIAAAMILLGAPRIYAQPLIDYHQHLLSPSAAELGSLPRPFTARDLIALLDAAGVYFDICGVAGFGNWQDKKTLIAEQIRQVGIKRILWGSDGACGAGITPEQALRAYRQLPLSVDEFHTIDTNLAPYMH